MRIKPISEKMDDLMEREGKKRKYNFNMNKNTSKFLIERNNDKIQFYKYVNNNNELAINAYIDEKTNKRQNLKDEDDIFVDSDDEKEKKPMKKAKTLQMHIEEWKVKNEFSNSFNIYNFILNLISIFFVNK
jgi:hypothetical protein